MPSQGDEDEQPLYHDGTRVPLPAHGCHAGESLQTAPEGARHSLQLADGRSEGGFSIKSTSPFLNSGAKLLPSRMRQLKGSPRHI